MDRDIEIISSPSDEEPLPEEVSRSKKSKKKKKKHHYDSKDSSDYSHKHKKSKHRKEKRHESSSGGGSGSYHESFSSSDRRYDSMGSSRRESSDRHSSSGRHDSSSSRYDSYSRHGSLSRQNSSSRYEMSYKSSSRRNSIEKANANYLATANFQDQLNNLYSAFNNQYKEQVLLNSPRGGVWPASSLGTFVQSNTPSPIGIPTVQTNVDRQLTLDVQQNINLATSLLAANQLGQTVATPILGLQPDIRNQLLGLSPNLPLHLQSTQPLSPGNFLKVTKLRPLGPIGSLDPSKLATPLKIDRGLGLSSGITSNEQVSITGDETPERDDPHKQVTNIQPVQQGNATENNSSLATSPVSPDAKEEEPISSDSDDSSDDSSSQDEKEQEQASNVNPNSGPNSNAAISEHKGENSTNSEIQKPLISQPLELCVNLIDKKSSESSHDLPQTSNGNQIRPDRFAPCNSQSSNSNRIEDSNPLRMQSDVSSGQNTSQLLPTLSQDIRSNESIVGDNPNPLKDTRQNQANPASSMEQSRQDFNQTPQRFDGTNHSSAHQQPQNMVSTMQQLPVNMNNNPPQGQPLQSNEKSINIPRPFLDFSNRPPNVHHPSTQTIHQNLQGMNQMPPGMNERTPCSQPFLRQPPPNLRQPPPNLRPPNMCQPPPNMRPPPPNMRPPIPSMQQQPNRQQLPPNMHIIPPHMHDVHQGNRPPNMQIRQPLPNMRHPPPHMQQQLQNMQQIPQGMQHPPPNMRNPPPHMQQKPQNMQNPSMDMQNRPTNFQQPPPNLRLPPPNIRVPPPNMRFPPPNMQHPPPNMQQPPLKFQQPPPNLHQGPPNMQQLPPNMQHPLPNMQQLPPNMQQPPFNMSQLPPNIQAPTSSVNQITSSVPPNSIQSGNMSIPPPNIQNSAIPQHHSQQQTSNLPLNHQQNSAEQTPSSNQQTPNNATMSLEYRQSMSQFQPQISTPSGSSLISASSHYETSASSANKEKKALSDHSLTFNEYNKYDNKYAGRMYSDKYGDSDSGRYDKGNSEYWSNQANSLDDAKNYRKDPPIRDYQTVFRTETVDVNHNKPKLSYEPIDSPTMSTGALGNADYTKIVQALAAIKSSASNSPQETISRGLDMNPDFDYEMSSRNVSKKGTSYEMETEKMLEEDAFREKERKSKKHKKHKKEKRKEIKKKLEAKLKELAALDKHDSDDDAAEEARSSTSTQPLSITINPKTSKFNLKIESPVMRGNIFQKYKNAQLLRNDGSMFQTKHMEHAERKYRKVAESGRFEGGKQNNEDSAEEGEHQTENNEPQTKEELIKMLGLEMPQKISKPTEKVVHSGSEDGEVVSEDDEQEEKKRIKDIIAKAKEEALKEERAMKEEERLRLASENENVPFLSEPVHGEELELTELNDEAVAESRESKREGKDDKSEGELSTDGEISSDGEISEDSLDEFGRSKKLRNYSSSDNDDKYRKRGYSSGSDSSDDDEVKERWTRAPTQEDNVESPNRERSHSLSASPERLISKDENTVEVTTEEKEEQPNNIEPEKTEEEIEEERKRKEEEAAEQERLREEVAKLETTIDSQAIRKKKQLLHRDAESSGTDISDNEEDGTIDTSTTIPEIKQQRSDTELDPKEELKQKLIEHLAAKKEEERKKSVTEEEQNRNKEAGFVDIFADVDMFADGKTNVEEDERPAIENTEEMQVDTNENNQKEVEPPQDEEQKKDNFEETLNTLKDIRNQMENMTKEELEEALKKLPSLNDVTHDPQDGRKTPIHLRDIEIPLVSITEYVHDKKALFKQVFRTINKKEFKFMLPKYLRKYDVKKVRNWCLDEMEIISKKRLKAILMNQYLASSSSESEDEDEPKKEKNGKISSDVNHPPSMEKQPGENMEKSVDEEVTTESKEEKKKKKKRKKDKSKKSKKEDRTVDDEKSESKTEEKEKCIKESEVKEQNEIKEDLTEKQVPEENEGRDRSEFKTEVKIEEEKNEKEVEE